MMKTFGKLKHGNDAYVYALSNAYIKIEVCNYGATLTRFIDLSDGKDVVLWFDDVSKYEKSDTCMGQTIGRVANRIEKGQFTLNGKQYQLDCNNNGNSLHGGLSGLHTVVFDVEVKGNEIICHYLSKDQESHYPGNMDIYIRYRLVDRKVIIEYEATSDQDTLCSLTNHSYFNLSDEASIEHHDLKIDADAIGMVDANGLTLPTILPVLNTPFDFKEYKSLKTVLNDQHEQLVLANHGLDHNFILNNKELSLVASLKYQNKVLNVYSDLHHMHVYTANYMHELNANGNIDYLKHAGIAFETQFYPNAINNQMFEQPILRKNEQYKSQTIFELVQEGK